MNAQLPAALAQHPFAQGFEPREIDQLAALARPVRFAKDDIVYREGEECDDFYLVVSGRVILEITPPSGAFTFGIVEAGDEFGWTAVLGSHDRVLQARALQDTQVIAFDAARLRALPLGLAQGARVTQPIAKGDYLTYENCAPDGRLRIVQLRREQDALVHEAVAA